MKESLSFKGPGKANSAT